MSGDIVEIVDEPIYVDIVAGGPMGPPGPSGVSGGTYVHDQQLASVAWVITHNLNAFPNVTTVDTAGTAIQGGVHYDSANQITVTFNSAQSGKAYIS